MEIIDVHHHWVNEKDYVTSLLNEMDRLGISRTGLIAMGAPFRRLFLRQPEPDGCVENDDLAALLRTHGDRFFGYGFFRLGTDLPDVVDRFAEQGFVGLKFHIPRWDYDDERAFPVYERAAACGMLCLFHTGVFALPEPLPQMRASSARCRPIMMDSIANAFPSLKMIIAHLGVCWGEEAATVARIHPNVSADLSGAAQGWRSSKPVQWFQEMLYWPAAHKKILFGSDVHVTEIETTLRSQLQLFGDMGWSEEKIACVMSGNAHQLLLKRQ